MATRERLPPRSRCSAQFWRLIWPLGLLYVVLLDSSRVFIGVHIPFDVVAGTILGWAIARIAFVAHEVYLAPWLDRQGMGTAGHAVARVVGPTNGREK